MRKYRDVQITVDQHELIEVICNCCEAVIPDAPCGREVFQGYYCGGFASKLGDMTEYSWDLCEDCLGTLFDMFKIDPRVG